LDVFGLGSVDIDLFRRFVGENFAALGIEGLDSKWLETTRPAMIRAAEKFDLSKSEFLYRVASLANVSSDDGAHGNATAITIVDVVSIIRSLHDFSANFSSAPLANAADEKLTNIINAVAYVVGRLYTDRGTPDDTVTTMYGLHHSILEFLVQLMLSSCDMVVEYATSAELATAICMKCPPLDSLLADWGLKKDKISRSQWELVLSNSSELCDTLSKLIEIGRSFPPDEQNLHGCEPVEEFRKWSSYFCPKIGYTEYLSVWLRDGVDEHTFTKHIIPKLGNHIDHVRTLLWKLLLDTVEQALHGLKTNGMDIFLRLPSIGAATIVELIKEDVSALMKSFAAHLKSKMPAIASAIFQFIAIGAPETVPRDDATKKRGSYDDGLRAAAKAKRAPRRVSSDQLRTLHDLVNCFSADAAHVQDEALSDIHNRYQTAVEHDNIVYDQLVKGMGQEHDGVMYEAEAIHKQKRATVSEDKVEAFDAKHATTIAAANSAYHEKEQAMKQNKEIADKVAKEKYQTAVGAAKSAEAKKLWGLIFDLLGAPGSNGKGNTITKEDIIMKLQIVLTSLWGIVSEAIGLALRDLPSSALVKWVPEMFKKHVFDHFAGADGKFDVHFPCAAVIFPQHSLGHEISLYWN
jgi:hypothetical protein